MYLLFEWFKQLVHKITSNKKIVIIKRKGYNIVLPFNIYAQIIKNGYRLDLTLYKGKPSCVQINEQINGKLKYICTLKNKMNVKGFKDHNVCNFSYDNLILKDK